MDEQSLQIKIFITKLNNAKKTGVMIYVLWFMYSY